MIYKIYDFIDHYILYSKDEDDCVSIIISKEDKTAEIYGIGNF